MADFLKRFLPEYIFVGCGREKDYSGENNMVAIRRDGYELMQLETFWLSPTPDVPGSRYANQSSCPRVCTHVVLRPLDGRPMFHFYNTHLDHESDEARVLGAQSVCRIMEERLDKWSFPMVLMGDFNAHPDSAPLRTFMENARLKLTDHTKGVKNSYHGYGRVNEPRIDYIMSRGFRAAGHIDIWNDETDGIYLSDHYPVGAYLEI